MTHPELNRARLLVWQIVVLVVTLGLWELLVTVPLFGGKVLLDPFFFSRPSELIVRIWQQLQSPVLWSDLSITLLEATLAFVIGSVLGILVGFWFARQPFVSAIFDPYLKAINSMPRIVLAPIFALWLGLGIWSKVALGVTLVFFIVFFNVYQGVRDISQPVLANARMLGLNDRQLLRYVYWPAALSWLFSSLHTSIGFAVIAAVVGEYLGASAGLGYRIAQSQAVFDVTGVFAGVVILAVFVIGLDAIVTRIEKRLLVWKPKDTGSVIA